MFGGGCGENRGIRGQRREVTKDSPRPSVTTTTEKKSLMGELTMVCAVRSLDCKTRKEPNEKGEKERIGKEGMLCWRYQLT